MKVLVTGAAGFIGYHAALRLLEQGDTVCGADSLNEYYDVRLKYCRLDALRKHLRFFFQKIDLADREACSALFAAVAPDRVVHLAAQAGVRYSIQNPAAYIDSNLVAFGNVLEESRRFHVSHLVYASSSSVYGANRKVSFSVEDNVDHPISLYAATKKANELMAHAYSHLYRMPSTGLRFFTVYGPWGRPDMATFLFTQAILAGKPIELFNGGNMERDFTYIDDVADAVVRILDHPAAPGSAGAAPHKVYNIGNDRPVRLLHMVEILEQCLGTKARVVLRPMQPGDVPSTHADISALEADFGLRPTTSIEVGLRRFVEWYQSHYAEGVSHAAARPAPALDGTPLLVTQ